MCCRSRVCHPSDCDASKRSFPALRWPEGRNLSGCGRTRCEQQIRESFPSNATLNWIERSSEEFAHLSIWGRMAQSTYHKVTLDSWLPSHVTPAVWLDCDTLVRGNRGRLWAMPMENISLLACTDSEIPSVSSPFGITEYNECGIPAHTPCLMQVSYWST